jgi:hypothetical protein
LAGNDTSYILKIDMTLKNNVKMVKNRIKSGFLAGFLSMMLGINMYSGYFCGIKVFQFFNLKSEK